MDPMRTASRTKASKQRTTALIAAGFAIVFWAAAYPAIRVGLRAFSPGQLAALRFLIATAFFAVYLAITRPRLPRGAALARISLAGALGIACYNLLLNTGEMTVSAGAASFLINCMPVFAALLAVAFLGERLRPLGWVGMAISVGGVAIIALGGEQHVRLGGGALFVLGAAACAAVMGLLQKPLLRDYNPVALTACLMASGELLLLPWVPGALAVAARPGSRSALLAVVFLGIAPAALGYLAWSMTLQIFPLTQTVSLLYLIPLVAVAISWVWIDERATTLTLVGGLVALGGVVLLNRFGRPVAQPRPAVPAGR